MQGQRYYLSGASVTHADIAATKGKRIEVKVSSYYFEPTTDGKGVKCTFVTSVATRQTTNALNSSMAQSVASNYLQGVMNLRRLLEKRDL
jgi:hypothetical protein